MHIPLRPVGLLEIGPTEPGVGDEVRPEIPYLLGNRHREAEIRNPHPSTVSGTYLPPCISVTASVHSGALSRWAMARASAPSDEYRSLSGPKF